MKRIVAGALAMLIALAGTSAAQGETWSVQGLVQLGKRAGPVPVANQWVTVHRIAGDSLGNVSGGPLDSVRTDSRGRYTIRYPRYGATDATYIAITTYAGVSYITSPFLRPNVTDDDALIMVFDTTSPPYRIKVAGRHIIITAPDAEDRRRVIEVYELMNDSTFTVMGKETNPVWRAPLPPEATGFEINPIGDISPAMTKRDGNWLSVFAPISPGIRQISFTYTLDADAFPLVLVVSDSATVFELLVQENEAVVEGGEFTEVAGVQQDGIPFRRFLAQNVPDSTAIRFSMPAPVRGVARKAVTGIAITLAVAMLLALGFVFWRRRRVAPAVTARAPVADPTATVVRELASLDMELESRTDLSAEARASLESRRAVLKAQLNAMLAGGSVRS